MPDYDMENEQNAGVDPANTETEATSSGYVEPTAEEKEAQGDAVSGTDAAPTGGETALSQPYSDLAGERAGVDTDFAEYEKTADSAEVAKGEAFSTPETTVQGQLATIMDKQGPLLQLAESRAKERASALGMSSSSAGMGAMYRAQLDQAMPMAQQDAQTAAAFKATEQAAVNEKRKIDQEAQVSGDLTLQKAKLQEQQKKIDDSFALAMKGLDADTEKTMMDAKGNWDLKINKANNEFQEKLQKSEISAQTSQLLMNQAHESMVQVQVSMQNLMGDSEFLDDMAAADEAAAKAKYGENPTDKQLAEFSGGNIKNYMNRLVGQSTNVIRFNAKAADLYTPEFQSQLAEMIEGVVW